MNAKVTMVLRIFLGLFLFTFGINKFLGFMPFPPIPGDGGILMGIYVSSGFMYLIGILEMAVGIALVSHKFIALALTFGVAILFNATVFHLLHDMGNIMGAAFGLILALVLVYAHKDRFQDLLKA